MALMPEHKADDQHRKRFRGRFRIDPFREHVNIQDHVAGKKIASFTDMEDAELFVTMKQTIEDLRQIGLAFEEAARTIGKAFKDAMDESAAQFEQRNAATSDTQRGGDE